MPSSLATIEQLKGVLNAGQAGAVFDASLAGLYLEAATDQVQGWCGREFLADPAIPDEGPAPAPVTRTVHASGRRMVRVPDVRQLETVTGDGITIAATDYELVRRRDEPAHALIIHRDVRQLELTGWFGWDPAPSAVVSATLTLAARAWHERDNRFADATVDPMGGPSAQYYRQLPASAQAQLALYRIPGFS